MGEQYKRDKRNCSIYIMRDAEESEELFTDIPWDEATTILRRIATAFGSDDRIERDLLKITDDDAEVVVMGADEDDLFQVKFFIEVQQ